jgi:hypothetical protein
MTDQVPARNCEDLPHDRESKVNNGGLRSLTGSGRRGGSRHLYPTLAQQVRLPLDDPIMGDHLLASASIPERSFRRVRARLRSRETATL